MCADVGIPTADVDTPAAGVDSPKVEFGTPKVEIGTPATGVYTQTADVDYPAADVDTPAVAIGTQTVEVGAPTVEIGTSAADVDSPTAVVDFPAAGVDSPAVEIGTPAAVVGTTAIGVDTLAAGVDTPVLDVEAAEVGIGIVSPNLIQTLLTDTLNDKEEVAKHLQYYEFMVRSNEALVRKISFLENQLGESSSVINHLQSENRKYKDNKEHQSAEMKVVRQQLNESNLKNRNSMDELKKKDQTIIRYEKLNYEQNSNILALQQSLNYHSDENAKLKTVLKMQKQPGNTTIMNSSKQQTANTVEDKADVYGVEEELEQLKSFVYKDILNILELLKDQVISSPEPTKSATNQNKDQNTETGNDYDSDNDGDITSDTENPVINSYDADLDSDITAADDVEYSWENSSSGKARRVMKKMGYKNGKGLGKGENGITEKIEPKLGKQRPKNRRKLLYIVSDSMLSYINIKRIRESVPHHDIRLHSHGGCTLECVNDHLPSILKHNPDCILLHVGTNNAVNNTSDEIIKKVEQLKIDVNKQRPGCTVYYSLPTIRTDNTKANSIISNLNTKMRRSKQLILDNFEVKIEQLGKKGLHLNSQGMKTMAKNIISFVKNL